MKVALHSTLREGAAADYRREHVRIPDELLALFDRAGIRDWIIWRSGDRLFHVVDCEDFDAAMAVIRADDADRRWQDHIGVYVDDFYGPEGEPGYLPLEQIWGLQDQRRPDAALPDMGID